MYEIIISPYIIFKKKILESGLKPKEIRSVKKNAKKNKIYC